MTSLDRLDNCIRVLDNTVIIGNDTLNTLDTQTEKIKLIKKKTNEMNPQISRSRYIINSMFRHNKKNEIIQYLILILLIGIAIMLIVLISTKN
jgi:hypothetical protein